MDYEITSTYWPEREITEPISYAGDLYPRAIRNMGMEPPRLEVKLVITDSDTVTTRNWNVLFDYNSERTRKVLVRLLKHLAKGSEGFYHYLRSDSGTFKYMEVIEFRLDRVEQTTRKNHE